MAPEPSHHTAARDRAGLALPVAALLTCALLGLYHIRTFDTFFHLASGRFILEHGYVPTTDPFSFTFRDAPWQNHSWGYQILVAKLHALGGFSALSLLQATLSASTCALALLACRRVRPLLAFAAVLALLPAACFREVLEARPHMLAFVCLAGCLLIVLRVDQGADRSRLLALIPLYLLWASVHGSHLLLFVILAVACLAAAIQRRSAPALGFALAIAVIFALGLWVAPGAFLQGGEHIASSFLESSVREWAPVTSDVLFTTLQGGSFLLLVCLSVLGLVSRPEDPAELRTLPRGPLPSLLLVCFTLLGFTSLRMLALFALGAGPLWLPFAARALFRIAHAAGTRSAPRIALAIVALAALLLVGSSFADSQIRTGVGLMEERLPVQALAALRRRGRVKHLYNAYNFGGYLIWERYPPAGVFVDGRAITLYPGSFLDTFERAYSDEKAFEALARYYSIDGVLLPTHSARTQKLIAYLSGHARFQRVHRDEVAVLFELREQP